MIRNVNDTIKHVYLVENKNVQFVASILKDKLPEKLKKEDFYVVELSPTDKLFRIEEVMRKNVSLTL